MPRDGPKLDQDYSLAPFPLQLGNLWDFYFNYLKKKTDYTHFLKQFPMTTPLNLRKLRVRVPIQRNVPVFIITKECKDACRVVGDLTFQNSKTINQYIIIILDTSRGFTLSRISSAEI